MMLLLLLRGCRSVSYKFFGLRFRGFAVGFCGLAFDGWGKGAARFGAMDGVA